MNLHSLHRAMAYGLLGIAVCAGSASAAEYTTIVQDISVDRPADVVWKKVGGYCDIATWLMVTCTYSSGTGDLGTVRRINDRIDEVMVAKTLHSYTYTQPTSTILYHGTLDVQADGRGRSKIIYTLFYDISPLTTPEARSADRDQRTARFAAALAAMKKMSEAP
jgi:polyketide cyclase/dehydrase/lipid transport protein